MSRPYWIETRELDKGDLTGLSTLGVEASVRLVTAARPYMRHRIAAARVVMESNRILRRLGKTPAAKTIAEVELTPEQCAAQRVEGGPIIYRWRVDDVDTEGE